MSPFPLLGLALFLADPPGPEQRALAYLAREVPTWARDNRCHSCHHNGDAARALYDALRRGRSVPATALAETTRWLTQPAGWDHNGGGGKESDRKLARLQFAAALVAAADAGLVPDRRPLVEAARLVAGLQEADGSWCVVAAGTLGSPATHGDALATYLARRTLLQADAHRWSPAIARAERWLRRLPVRTIPDAAAVLLALRGATDAQAGAQRDRCLALLRKGQAREGGWGPYAHAAPEVFDTALVVLALAGPGDAPGWRAMRRRGRAYLIAQQQPDGHWIETTRPPGADSYAQRLSTTAWATLALLAAHDPAP